MDKTEAMTGNVSCDVRHTGHVSCSTPTILSSRCQADAKRWPYDTHQCSLSMGSPITTASEVDLRQHEQPVSLVVVRVGVWTDGGGCKSGGVTDGGGGCKSGGVWVGWWLVLRVGV
ncbi:hypothetical protein PR048_010659 [Dryococelus australis]|uniref:Neurotransmitter-gated ion-channel ligand-binding domain-containing protein n=1 Tax=Dryococelus australis TaxID=614101 RepID=A0ABQ9I4E8_9NEOP|nr:hypothetical protein PR048_010659 [Dryococelus australis]